MDKELEAMKNVALGRLAESLPKKVSECLEMVEKMQGAILELCSEAKTENDRAVNIVAYTIAFCDSEEMLNKIGTA